MLAFWPERCSRLRFTRAGSSSRRRAARSGCRTTGDLAFADYRRGVYLTDLRSPERLVFRGHGLSPYDFTRRGDVVGVAGSELLLVSRAGKVLSRLPFRAGSGYAIDRRSDAYVLVTPSGRPARLHDRRLRLGQVVSGLGELSVIADRTIALTGTGRLSVIHEDGSVVASAARNPREQTPVVPPAASPDGLCRRLDAPRPQPAAPRSAARAGDDRLGRATSSLIVA